MTDGGAGGASSAFEAEEADRFARSSHPAQATKPNKMTNHASEECFRSNMAGFLYDLEMSPNIVNKTSQRWSQVRNKRFAPTAYFVRGSFP
jgi:hypothetical protein